MIECLKNEGAIANAATVGTYLKAQFTQELEGLGVQVRGFGMMIGIELPVPCAALVAQARDEQHLIINVTADKVVRLLPPLNLSQADADELVKRLTMLIKDFLASA